MVCQGCLDLRLAGNKSTTQFFSALNFNCKNSALRYIAIVDDDTNDILYFIFM
jgi:hypothetical protein